LFLLSGSQSCQQQHLGELSWAFCSRDRCRFFCGYGVRGDGSCALICIPGFARRGLWGAAIHMGGLCGLVDEVQVTPCCHSAALLVLPGVRGSRVRLAAYSRVMPCHPCISKLRVGVAAAISGAKHWRHVVLMACRAVAWAVLLL
jgi:hypothetical protein